MENENRRILKGTVISTKMDKTIVVNVDRQKRHPLYLKVVKTAKKYLVHDENKLANEGDFVSIVETRPISKRKRWRLKEIITKAQ